jgi:hypothetical protein
MDRFGESTKTELYEVKVGEGWELDNNIAREACHLVTIQLMDVYAMTR